MARTSIFKNNGKQAVRLPKALALPNDVSEVEIAVIGHTRIISPVDAVWDSWFDGPGVSDDFMQERDQPEGQQR